MSLIASVTVWGVLNHENLILKYTVICRATLIASLPYSYTGGEPYIRVRKSVVETWYIFVAYT